MNLNIELNIEQQAAADSLLEDYNKNLEEKVSEKEYFEKVISGIVNERVETLFKNSAQRLVDASKALPYEARIALIKEVEEKLS